MFLGRDTDIIRIQIKTMNMELRWMTYRLKGVHHPWLIWVCIDFKM